MSKSGRMGDLEAIFEILVTSYAHKDGSLPAEGDLCWRPATDAYETDEFFIVQMDLAGLDPSQVEVLADEESLLVRGIREEAVSVGKKHFHKMEIRVGPFARRVPLTVTVDPSSAEARYRNGFLCVTFRKGSGKRRNQSQIAINR
ncbi:MAG: Hsp20/alpha crystallin family protein [Gemmatimonadales bacterium]|nr:Hsp20/alpha crystallin family protein [Gemmatimonadales bacterium]